MLKESIRIYQSMLNNAFFLLLMNYTLLFLASYLVSLRLANFE